MSLTITKLSEQSKDQSIQKLLIYALPGAGKTTLATKLFPGKKTLILDTEQGTRFLPPQENIDILHIDHYFSTEETLEFQNIIKEYEVVVLDSIGQLQEMFMKSPLLKPQHKKEDGSLSLQGYGFMKNKMSGFIDFLYSNVNTVVIIAHQSSKDMAREEGEATTSVIAPTITGGLFDLLVAKMEMIIKLQNMTNPKTKKLERFVRMNDEKNSFIAKDRAGIFSNKNTLTMEKFITDFTKFNK